MLSHFNYRSLQPPRKTFTKLSTGNNGHGPHPRRKAHALSGGEEKPKGPSLLPTSMGPSYRDEIMVQMLEMKRELKRELQGEIWSSRAGALGTTSYEQYYAQKNIRTKGIDQIFQGLKTMPPVDEDHLGTIASHSCLPLLPGKESSENTDMLPQFLNALMSLDGAEGGAGSMF
ncbi:hypothetical protein CEUSTIGMA_g11227.t1 [Chlamydomonas eustigma]|uniref:Uncharacterized protein n=1 Tax=Chlamydomonas eustigma TaxID=1157962 RepID=A0A250XLN1_9CHLO|nr:hypothetical protein CEUSTIGMA_g11227.t1 [Chlamydomonas eustigma]|eukprot:GAX83802.1 hypothetical protein CEUSTIGMA_g11227.t1 [Chlamydomonas eustigma]